MMMPLIGPARREHGQAPPAPNSHLEILVKGIGPAVQDRRTKPAPHDSRGAGFVRRTGHEIEPARGNAWGTNRRFRRGLPLGTCRPRPTIRLLRPSHPRTIQAVRGRGAAVLPCMANAGERWSCRATRRG